MLLKHYKIQFREALKAIFDESEIDSFFYIILETFHKLKRIDLALNPSFELDTLHLLQWETVLADLKKQKPLQYILGETEFFGLPFLVNENTLIPRQETEELVDWIIKDLKIVGLQDLKILDVGTGSGCIAISLSKNIPNASVFALDVCEKALAIAEKNAELNDVHITFLHQNILEVENLNQKFDVIVSNPPYVRNLEKQEIQKNVLEYEPHLALFVEDHDALLFYRKIATLAIKNLSKNGILYFEINQYLGKEMIEMLDDLGFKNMQLKKDIYGNDRMICCFL